MRPVHDARQRIIGGDGEAIPRLYAAGEMGSSFGHLYLAGGNLLKREVTADDVAEAFVSLALARKTTGAVLTVDGGNIAAAMR